MAMKNFILIVLIFATSFTIGNQSCLTQEPYKLGVQENVQGNSGGYSSYPKPQMMSAPAIPAPVVKKQKKVMPGQTTQNNSQLNGQINRNTPQEMFAASGFASAGITAVALPPAFLGVWQVHGQRTAVDALPEFQAGAQQAFSISNDQMWNISGNQGNYTLGSNTGISTSLFVDKVQGNTAYVRYQHPVGNTMAQEAIVMSLRPGGAQFDGLERISIVKQGLSQPRAKVTYQLTGSRQ